MKIPVGSVYWNRNSTMLFKKLISSLARIMILTYLFCRRSIYRLHIWLRIRWQYRWHRTRYRLDRWRRLRRQRQHTHTLWHRNKQQVTYLSSTGACYPQQAAHQVQHNLEWDPGCDSQSSVQCRRER